MPSPDGSGGRGVRQGAVARIAATRAGVGIAVVTVVVLAMVVGALAWTNQSRAPDLARVGPADPMVAEVERRVAGAAVREFTLTAAPATVRLGDRTVSTWAFNGAVPGPELRVRAGEVVKARVVNRLPEPLTVHWHGIALRNDMDGVPGVTQRAVAPGASYGYEFTAPDPGTYFYHPHTGTQLDRGLYAPLIVEDPAETSPLRDITLMLDDWVDGTGRTPDDVLAELRAAGSDMAGHGAHGGMDPDAGPLGEDTGDVTYPAYLINGQPPAQPAEYRVKPGERVRLRLVNAAADTPFRVAFGGGRLTVVASDGFGVQPVTVDTLLIGMGERYDVLVTVPDSGVFPLVAVAEGKDAQALAVLRSGAGAVPDASVRPAELDGKLLRLDELHATPEVALPAGAPDRGYQATLTADMTAYRWGIAVPKVDGVTLPVRRGERIRLRLRNSTMMWHPMHLHGHTFQVVTGGAPRAPARTRSRSRRCARSPWS